MKGCRPLSNEEIIEVKKQFSGTFSIRNRSLFMLGVSVRGRIEYPLFVPAVSLVNSENYVMTKFE